MINNSILAYFLFGEILFFSITPIFGVQFGTGGTTDSNLYLIINIFGFTYSILLMVKQIVKNKLKVSPINLYTLTGIFVFVFIGIVEKCSNTRTFHIFGIFSIPAFLIGLYYAINRQIKDLLIWFDVIMSIITLCALLSLPNLISSIYSGDVYYSQSISYNMSLAFAINVFLLKYGNTLERFKFTTSTWYTLLCYSFIPIQLAILFISGGKGGFLVVLISLMFLFIRANNKLKIIFWILISVIFLSSICSFLIKYSDVFSVVFEQGFNRVFSYITKDGIDLNQTSGRDEVYSHSIQLIKNNPFGYGIFKYQTYLLKVGQTYPHNIFLEWLLQGGVIYFIACSQLMCFCMVKLKRMIGKESIHILLTPIVIYTFTMLLVSASYLMQPMFWFIIGYTLNYKLYRR